jgi:hypothetical protein
VKMTMQETWPGIPPKNCDELWTRVRGVGWSCFFSALRSIWLSLWQDEWNHSSKHKGSGLRIKGVSFWKHPLSGAKALMFTLYVSVILWRQEWEEAGLKKIFTFLNFL